MVLWMSFLSCFPSVHLIFLFKSVFFAGLFSDVTISVTLGLWTVCLEFGRCILSLRSSKKQIFKYCVAGKTWGSYGFDSGVVTSWCVKPCSVCAAIRNSCHLDWWWKEAAVFLPVAEFSTPAWPPMVQGQKSSEVLICRCVAVPSADFWHVRTCPKQTAFWFSVRLCNLGFINSAKIVWLTL